VSVRRARLDAEIVRRGLAPSRERAAALVAAGRVRIAGQTAVKPATGVTRDDPVVIEPDPDGTPTYASRAGHKLAHALETFAPAGLTVAGLKVLDAGAATGGFTDVLLRNGATQVVAVDVGYGQLVWELQNDPRVVVVDRTNVRTLTPELIGGPADLATADLSFIGLGLVLPALLACVRLGASLVVLVKPQFEVGRELLGPGGVVRDPALRAQAVRDVAGSAATLGLGVRGVVASPLPGPAGNVEYVLWLGQDAPPLREDQLARAIAEGPQ
jgi:23S rRNA (cytidine1920-2'-O)/16S rRNA (cytidine1409-2'-O)-methyltransferase